MASNSDPYTIYLRSFAVSASGSRLTQADCGTTKWRRFFQPFDQRGQVAVALAAQDTAKDLKLRGRKDFEQQLAELLA